MNSCKWCKKETKNKSFCSNLCSREHNKKIITSRPKRQHSSVCQECLITFHPKDKRTVFCSHSCSAIYHNRSRKKISIKCPVCNKEHKGKTVFCCNLCKNKDFIEKWLDGKVDGGIKYTLSSVIRNFLLEEAKYECTQCGESRTRSDGSRILQIDHINGSWQDNSRSNLRVLCPTCHALTDTYGAKNMGNGRKWKKKYNQF